MACSITNPLDCLTSAAKSAAGDAFSGIATDFAKAADSTIKWLWGQLGQATAVHLGGVGFDQDLAIVAAITGVVAVGLFLIQVATSVVRRDPGGLKRAVKGLFIAFLAGGVAVGVTNLALSAVDSLSAGIVQVTMGTSIDRMGPQLISTTAIVSVTNPAGMFLLAIVAILASVVVWGALLVRKALIVVSAVFAPLAFAGSLADITVGWTRKWIEMMAALILSKLVLVLIFVIGWGILDGRAGEATTGRTLATQNASATQSVTQTATGLLILALAGFAPWMALKLVHFSEDQFHRLHVLSSGTSSGARSAVAAPQKVAAWRSAGAGLGLGAAASRAGGTGGSAATATANGANGGNGTNGTGQASPTQPPAAQPPAPGGTPPASPPAPGPSQSPPAPGSGPPSPPPGPPSAPGSRPRPAPPPGPSPVPEPVTASQATSPPVTPIQGPRPITSPGGAR